jgi:Luciferase-like monooxygenase
VRLVTSYRVRTRLARRLKSRRDCRGRPAVRSTPPRSARRNRPPGRCASVPRRSPTDNRPKSAPRVLSVIVAAHQPAVLTAKLMSTDRFLSKGRLTLGIGVGWCREEFEATGAAPFDDRRHVTDEWMDVCKELWTADLPKFSGKCVNSTMWSSRRSRCRIRFRFGSGEKAGLPYGAPSTCAASCSTCQALISITRREAGLRLRNTT